MKTKNKILKDFDTVKTFREIKSKVSNDIKDMDFEQLQAYLDKNKLKPKATPHK
ncbi:MAG: hypothetical protein M3Z26_12690 [Bacteroidota bacterium]|nr:hypothetical protein [Bacteroidota bacterium]